MPRNGGAFCATNIVMETPRNRNDKMRKKSKNWREEEKSASKAEINFELIQTKCLELPHFV